MDRDACRHEHDFSSNYLGFSRTMIPLQKQVGIHPDGIVSCTVDGGQQTKRKKERGFGGREGERERKEGLMGLVAVL